METIRKIWLVPFVFVILFTQCEKEPEPEPIVDIRDVNFLQALVDSGIDTDGNGLISSAEAAKVTSLDVSNYDISDLQGIENFTFLEILDCSGNMLTSLDVCKNLALIDLHCSMNQLTNLNVSNCSGLELIFLY